MLHVVLDIDGTLIDSVRYTPQQHNRILSGEFKCPPPDHIITETFFSTYSTNTNDPKAYHYIYKRPHLHEFIDYLFSNFVSVSLWTASPRTWAEEVAVFLLKDTHHAFRLIIDGRRCILKYNHETGAYAVIKPLNKIWRSTDNKTKYGMNRDNLIIIDDTRTTFTRNYGNAIYIPTFEALVTHGDTLILRQETYLLKLITFLTNLQEQAKTRPLRNINKQGWHI
jgi:hypothetical protein